MKAFEVVVIVLVLQIVMAWPAGEIILRRRIDTHLLALESIGAQIEVSAYEYRMSAQAH